MHWDALLNIKVQIIIIIVPRRNFWKHPQKGYFRSGMVSLQPWWHFDVKGELAWFHLPKFHKEKKTDYFTSVMSRMKPHCFQRKHKT